MLYYFERTANANWSAQEVGREPQVLPLSFWAISVAVIPSQSLAMAFRFPLQPPSKLMFLITSPSRVKCIRREQVPLVL